MRFTTKDNFAYLTAALILLLLTAAISDGLGWKMGQLAVQAGVVLMLTVGVWSIRTKTPWFMTRIGLTLAVLLLALLSAVLNFTHQDLLWLATLVVYLIVTAWVAMHQVLFTGTVDTNKIIGAICVFLLFGMIWDVLYTMFAMMAPDAFNGLAPGLWNEILPDLVYFSFVTLTTLGYGDISPAASLVRFLAFMEAMVGQFYLAILVASLIGARLSKE